MIFPSIGRQNFVFEGFDKKEGSTTFSGFICILIGPHFSFGVTMLHLHQVTRKETESKWRLLSDL